MIPKTGDVGVIVGRFQVHRLHEAHVALIRSVLDSHRQLIVVLGLSRARVTTSNPLDFESRKRMILDTFKDDADRISVFYVNDESSDYVWSNRLDGLIEGGTSPAQKIVLYGGRDSFVNRYNGVYKTEILEPQVFASGTELRKGISREVRGTEDFRAGVIWATANGYPRVYPTVDIAVYRGNKQTCCEHGSDYHYDDPIASCYAAGCKCKNLVLSPLEWLVVRKSGESGWRFPGGFAQPSDGAWEQSARRELMEETGVEASTFRYAGSLRVDDWRYRNEDDKIVTTLFVAEHMFGGPKPSDDVAEARWAAEANLDAQSIVAEHLPLLGLARRAVAEVRK